MNKHKLRQLQYLKSEIALLKDQIAETEFTITTDKVTGSEKEWPYTKRSFTIQGIDYSDYKKKTRKIRNKLQRRVEDLIDLLAEINAWIESIEDSLLRQVITLRHVSGCTWDEVAAKIGGGNTGESVRKMHDRYFDEN